MRSSLLTIMALFFGLSSAATTKMMGFDMSDPCTTFDCFKGKGYSFTIPRAYQSKEVNWWPVLDNLKSAKAAGMDFVDVYFFPCREWEVRSQVN